MKLILVSDIFGATPALKEIQDELSPIIADTCTIDPYRGRLLDFKNQTDAYQYFMSHIGLENYQSILEAELKVINSPVILIGFSVGASVIWNLSSQSDYNDVKKAFGFYGSQIRNQSGISSLFDIELIFPQKEPHFDVDRLIKKIEPGPNVYCRKAGGAHGFMNKLSEGFNQTCYCRHMDELKRELKRLTNEK